MYITDIIRASDNPLNDRDKYYNLSFYLVCVALAINLYIFCIKLIYKCFSKKRDEKICASNYISDDYYFEPNIEKYYFRFQACGGFPCYSKNILTEGTVITYVENYFEARNNTKPSDYHTIINFNIIEPSSPQKNIGANLEHSFTNINVLGDITSDMDDSFKDMSDNNTQSLNTSHIVNLNELKQSNNKCCSCTHKY